MFWIGFVVFGWGYWLLVFHTIQSPSYGFRTAIHNAVDDLHPFVARETKPYTPEQQKAMEEMPRMLRPRRWVRPNPGALVTFVNFAVAPVYGLLGGMLAVYYFNRNTKTEGEP